MGNRRIKRRQIGLVIRVETGLGNEALLPFPLPKEAIFHVSGELVRIKDRRAGRVFASDHPELGEHMAERLCLAIGHRQIMRAKRKSGDGILTRTCVAAGFILQLDQAEIIIAGVSERPARRQPRHTAANNDNARRFLARRCGKFAVTQAVAARHIRAANAAFDRSRARRCPTDRTCCNGSPACRDHRAAINLHISPIPTRRRAPAPDCRGGSLRPRGAPCRAGSRTGGFRFPLTGNDCREE